MIPCYNEEASIPKFYEETKSVINTLRDFNNSYNTYFGVKVNLSYLIQKFEPYEHLLNILIEDPFISKEDKQFVNDFI